MTEEFTFSRPWAAKSWKTAKRIDIEKAIKSGEDVNARDADGWSPLHYAARFSTRPSCTKALLKAGADVNARDQEDLTPLHVAATFGNRTAAVVLLAAGANVNARDNENSTPLHMACQNRRRQALVRLLLSAGADVDAVDSFFDATPREVARICKNTPARDAIVNHIRRGEKDTC